MIMILVDSHCHLDLLLKEADLDSLVAKARENNVHYMQTICTKLENMDNLLAITSKYPSIYTSVGVHPCEVEVPVHCSVLVDFLGHNKVIGIGETGLDYYYSTENVAKQKESFVNHILAAQMTGNPIIIHTRDADSDTIDIISSEMRNANFKGLIHCFTASKELAYKMLDLGIYISISGIVTFKNADNLRDIVKGLPLDRLLIETDSPYLAPVPMRKYSNQPAFVHYVAECIAQLQKVDIQEVATSTTNNFFQLFTKAKKIIH